MMWHTLGVFRSISAYCKWAESKAKTENDLLVFVLGPVLLLCLVLWSLPAWLGKGIALVLLLPVLYLVLGVALGLASLVLRSFTE